MPSASVPAIRRSGYTIEDLVILLLDWASASAAVTRRRAIIWLAKARSANPEHPLPHAYLASAYALKDEAERAAAELAQARKLASDDRYSSIARLRALAPFGVPKIRTLFEATYLVGLRKAGVAEE